MRIESSNNNNSISVHSSHYSALSAVPKESSESKQEKNKDNDPSILTSLFEAFGSELLIALPMKLVYDCIQFTGLFSLN